MQDAERQVRRYSLIGSFPALLSFLLNRSDQALWAEGRGSCHLNPLSHRYEPSVASRAARRRSRPAPVTTLRGHLAHWEEEETVYLRKLSGIWPEKQRPRPQGAEGEDSGLLKPLPADQPLL